MFVICDPHCSSSRKASPSVRDFQRAKSERGCEKRLVAVKNRAIGKTMTETENAILQSLLELEATIKTMPTANPKPNLVPLFERIDGLTRQLPRDTDPGLLHYLHKKSYEKARLFLQGRDAENAHGNCGHVG